MPKRRRLLTLLIITLFLSACQSITTTSTTVPSSQTTSLSTTTYPTTNVSTTAQSGTTVPESSTNPTTGYSTSFPATSVPTTTFPTTHPVTITTISTQIVESEILSISTNITEGGVSLSKPTPLLNDYIMISATDAPGFMFEHWRDLESGQIVTFDTSFSLTLSSPRSFEAVYLPEGFVDFYLFSTNDSIITRNINGPITEGTTVSLQAETSEDAQFVAWFDLIQEKDISTENPVTIEASQSRYLVAVYAAEVSDYLAYSTDFEDATKSAYAAAAVETGNQQWWLADSLIGSGTSDQKADAKSVRMKAGYLETQFALTDVTAIRFQYGQYGTDASETITASVSANQTDWIQLAEMVSDTTFKTFFFSFTETWFQENSLGLDTPLTFRIEGLAETRTNIDQVSIFQTNFRRDAIPEVISSPAVEYSGYYEGIGGLTGDALILALRDILREGFTMLSYGDARYVLSFSDRDPETNYESVRGIYDNAVIATEWISTGEGAWQREHVWPNSKLGIPRVDNSSKNQGSDLHNLRAITGINQTRSNRYFAEGSGIATTIGSEGFYPGDEHKGDVARILFYMDIMYDELNLTNDITMLENNPDTNYTLEGAYAGILDLLLQWHIEDPVDEFELHRNEFIYSGVAIDPYGKEINPQGNRNPFIDHPELVELIWVEESSLPIS